MPSRVPTYRPPRPKLATVSKGPDRTPEAAERHKFYCTARWTRLRLLKLARDPLCAHCLKKQRLTPASHVHHEQEVKDRPDLALDLDNLTSLCRPCHTRHHNAVRRGDA